MGMGDLVEGMELPRDDVEAVLKAGLAVGGVPKGPMVEPDGAGVDIMVGAVDLLRIGVMLLVVLRIGVRRGVDRDGDCVSRQTTSACVEVKDTLISSSLLLLFWVLLMLLFKAPFWSLRSSRELLVVTETRALKQGLKMFALQR